MKLKPCPCCGSEDIEIIRCTRSFCVCKECGMRTRDFLGFNILQKDSAVQEAAEAWNKRKNPTHLDVIGAIQEALPIDEEADDRIRKLMNRQIKKSGNPRKLTRKI